MNTSEAKYLYGRMHFEDGQRPAILERGPRHFYAYFIDGAMILRRYVLFREEKFFKEWTNSDVNMKEIKRVVRFMRNKSKITGLKREIPKQTRIAFNEILGTK